MRTTVSGRLQARRLSHSRYGRHPFSSFIVTNRLGPGSAADGREGTVGESACFVTPRLAGWLCTMPRTAHFRVREGCEVKVTGCLCVCVCVRACGSGGGGARARVCGLYRGVQLTVVGHQQQQRHSDDIYDHSTLRSRHICVRQDGIKLYYSNIFRRMKSKFFTYTCCFSTSVIAAYMLGPAPGGGVERVGVG